MPSNSIAAKMAAASAEAQGVLAQVGGASAETANALYNARKITAVFGLPYVDRKQLTNGAWRQRTVVPTSATRAQFTAAPKAEDKFVRTDGATPVTYTIVKVDQHDPFLYVLTLQRAGE